MLRLRPLAFALLATMATLCLARPIPACPSGYESAVRLAKGAHHLVEVEVVSVEDEPAPTPKDARGRTADDGTGRERKAARARVRVVRDLRGRMPMAEFTLVGGPYRSCAPYERYLHFRPAEHLCLILARPVPVGTSTIVIEWRGRVVRGGASELDGIVAAGAKAWEHRRSLLRRVDPAAMKAADELLASRARDGDWPAQTLQPLPYAVLAGIATLLADPTRDGALLPGRRDPATRDTPTTYHADADSLAPALAPHLGAEIARRIEFGVEEAAAVIAFHRKAVATMLVDEFGQPADRARRFVESVPVRDWTTEVVPLDGLSPERQDDRELRSISLLLELASDEPDGLVWTMTVRPDELDGGVFAPWLSHHVGELPDGPTYLKVTLALRSKEAAPHVVKAFAGASEDWRVDEFLAFFVAIGDVAHTDESLGRLAHAVTVATAPGANDDAAASARWTIEEAIKALETVGDAGKAIRPRLDALLIRLPAK